MSAGLADRPRVGPGPGTREKGPLPVQRAAVTALGYRHQRVQRLRRLCARRNARADEGVVVAEGAKVLGEALRAGVAVESVYLEPAAGPAERSLAEACLAAGARVFDLEAGVLARVTATVTPQPVVGVVRAPAWDLPAALAAGAGPLVVLAGVRDPGNAGTVLRSVDAAGGRAVVSCDGSVDLFNPKTVRASAGAVFHVAVVNGAEVGTTLQALGRAGLRRLGAAAHGGVDHLDADLTGALALVLGNEASGLPAQALDGLDGLVTVRLEGRAESLNVGMAAAVLCFEAARQRRVAQGRSGG